jgi:phosphoglycolate phosphatase
LVLFDLDGTLVDSAPDLAYSVNTMLTELGLPNQKKERLREWIGNGAERLVKRALTGSWDEEPDPGLFQQAFARFSAIYRENTSKRSRLYPGVREGLHYLVKTHRRLGCITNKRGQFTEPLLKSFRIYDDFSIVVSGDTLPKKKPDPLPLLHAVETLGVALEDALMIGDSVNDVEAARAAGLRVFCVRYGYNNGDNIENARPDLVLDSLAELPAYI